MKEIQIHFVRNIQNITQFKKIFIYFYFSISIWIWEWWACTSTRMFLITHIYGWKDVPTSFLKLFFFTVISTERCSKNLLLSLSPLSWWTFMLLFLIFPIFLLFWKDFTPLPSHTSLFPMTKYQFSNHIIFLSRYRGKRKGVYHKKLFLIYYLDAHSIRNRIVLLYSKFIIKSLTSCNTIFSGLISLWIILKECI